MISALSLKYLIKISFNQKITQLSSSPWFNNLLKNFWMIFEMFLKNKNWVGGGMFKILESCKMLDLEVVKS